MMYKEWDVEEYEPIHLPAGWPVLAALLLALLWMILP